MSRIGNVSFALVMIVILTVSNSLAFGSTILIPASASGGGSVSVTEFVDEYSYDIHESLDFSEFLGIDVSSWVSNNNWKGQNVGNTNMHLQVKQGVNDRYYKFEDASFNVYTWDENDGSWTAYARASFLLLDKLPAHTEVDMNSHINLNLFGSHISLSVNVDNDWYWPYFVDAKPIRTDDYNISMNLEVESLTATIYSTSLTVNEWTSSYDGLTHLEVTQYISGHLPEPATLTVLAIGSIFILRRRRLRNCRR